MQQNTFPDAPPLEIEPKTDVSEVVVKPASKLRRIAVWTTAGTLTTGAVFALQNKELLSATYEYYTYSTPEDGDIIPERIGCDILPEDASAISVIEVEESVPELYVPQTDPVFLEVSDKQSASNTFTDTSASKYSESERIFWPFNNYFDTGIGRYDSSLGVEFSFFMHEGDIEFIVDYEAMDQMAHDIFGSNNAQGHTLTDIYGNPEVAEIVSCKRRQILDEMKLDGTRADVNIVVGGDTGFEGNNVIKRTQERNFAHSSGLGISDIAVQAGPWQLTPDHLMLVSGGNGHLEVSERILNWRFLHELIHVLMFQDLSDTVAERDEQERLVSFMEKKLLEYYKEHGSLPIVIRVEV
jgi:hypothetical protein